MQECPARFGSALSDVLTMPPPMPAPKNVQVSAPAHGGVPGSRP
jgi:hypothetical protein